MKPGFPFENSVCQKLNEQIPTNMNIGNIHWEFLCVTNDYHISDITFLRGRGESSGVHPEATSSPLTSTSTRLETSGGWDIMRSI